MDFMLDHVNRCNCTFNHEPTWAKFNHIKALIDELSRHD